MEGGQWKSSAPTVSRMASLMKIREFLMTKQKGKWSLWREHSYFYQVQAQINICSFEFGDFVLWTEDGIMVERIARDREFYEEAMKNIEHVFVYSVLADIIGKWYTHSPIANSAGVVIPPDHQMDVENGSQVDLSEDDDEGPWCYCEQPSSGNMTCCDNKACTIK